MFTVVLFDACNYLVREFSAETLEAALAQAQPIWNNRIEHDEYMRREVYQGKTLIESVNNKGGKWPRMRGTYEMYFMA
jgi:hypothetical protein